MAPKRKKISPSPSTKAATTTTKSNNNLQKRGSMSLLSPITPEGWTPFWRGLVPAAEYSEPTLQQSSTLLDLASKLDMMTTTKSATPTTKATKSPGEVEKDETPYKRPTTRAHPLPLDFTNPIPRFSFRNPQTPEEFRRDLSPRELRALRRYRGAILGRNLRRTEAVVRKAVATNTGRTTAAARTTATARETAAPLLSRANRSSAKPQYQQQYGVGLPSSSASKRGKRREASTDDVSGKAKNGKGEDEQGWAMENEYEDHDDLDYIASEEEDGQHEHVDLAASSSSSSSSSSNESDLFVNQGRRPTTVSGYPADAQPTPRVHFADEIEPPLPTPSLGPSVPFEAKCGNAVTTSPTKRTEGSFVPDWQGYSPRSKRKAQQAWADTLDEDDYAQAVADGLAVSKRTRSSNTVASARPAPAAWEARESGESEDDDDISDASNASPPRYRARNDTGSRRTRESLDNPRNPDSPPSTPEGLAGDFDPRQALVDLGLVSPRPPADPAGGDEDGDEDEDEDEDEDGDGDDDDESDYLSYGSDHDLNPLERRIHRLWEGGSSDDDGDNEEAESDTFDDQGERVNDTIGNRSPGGQVEARPPGPPPPNSGGSPLGGAGDDLSDYENHYGEDPGQGPPDYAHAGTPTPLRAGIRLRDDRLPDNWTHVREEEDGGFIFTDTAGYEHSEDELPIPPVIMGNVNPNRVYDIWAADEGEDELPYPVPWPVPLWHVMIADVTVIQNHLPAGWRAVSLSDDVIYRNPTGRYQWTAPVRMPHIPHMTLTHHFGEDGLLHPIHERHRSPPRGSPLAYDPFAENEHNRPEDEGHGRSPSASAETRRNRDGDRNERPHSPVGRGAGGTAFNAPASPATRDRIRLIGGLPLPAGWPQLPAAPTGPGIGGLPMPEGWHPPPVAPMGLGGLAEGHRPRTHGDGNSDGNGPVGGRVVPDADAMYRGFEELDQAADRLLGRAARLEQERDDMRGALEATVRAENDRIAGLERALADAQAEHAVAIAALQRQRDEAERGRQGEAARAIDEQQPEACKRECEELKRQLQAREAKKAKWKARSRQWKAKYDEMEIKFERDQNTARREIEVLQDQLALFRESLRQEKATSRRLGEEVKEARKQPSLPPPPPPLPADTDANDCEGRCRRALDDLGECESQRENLEHAYRDLIAESELLQQRLAASDSALHQLRSARDQLSTLGRVKALAREKAAEAADLQKRLDECEERGRTVQARLDRVEGGGDAAPANRAGRGGRSSRRGRGGRGGRGAARGAARAARAARAGVTGEVTGGVRGGGRGGVRGGVRGGRGNPARGAPSTAPPARRTGWYRDPATGRLRKGSESGGFEADAAPELPDERRQEEQNDRPRLESDTSTDDDDDDQPQVSRAKRARIPIPTTTTTSNNNTHHSRPHQERAGAVAEQLRKVRAINANLTTKISALRSLNRQLVQGNRRIAEWSNRDAEQVARLRRDHDALMEENARLRWFRKVLLREVRGLSGLSGL